MDGVPDMPKARHVVLTCAHCGAQAIYVHEKGANYPYVVKCSDNSCGITTCKWSNPAGAVNSWNKRMHKTSIIKPSYPEDNDNLGWSTN